MITTSTNVILNQLNYFASTVDQGQHEQYNKTQHTFMQATDKIAIGFFINKSILVLHGILIPVYWIYIESQPKYNWHCKSIWNWNLTQNQNDLTYIELNLNDLIKNLLFGQSWGLRGTAIPAFGAVFAKLPSSSITNKIITKSNLKEQILNGTQISSIV